MAQDGNKLTGADIQIDMIHRSQDPLYISLFIPLDIFMREIDRLDNVVIFLILVCHCFRLLSSRLLTL